MPGRHGTAWLLALLALSALPAMAGHKVRCATLQGEIYLFLQDVAGFYGMRYTGGGQVARLDSAYSALSFRKDRREAVLNGVKVHLSHAPGCWQENHLMLSETDFRLLLEPLLRPRSLQAPPVRRIVLDPGHGGKDNGTRGKNHLEKTITLQVARLAARELRQAGFHVSLTREGDGNLTLPQRSQIAARQKGDLFVSLHANYVEKGQASGIETFTLAPSGTASTYSKSAGPKAALGNRFDLLNARLAYDLQKSLLAATGAPDRGIKRARFAVLREAPCPAVLIEMGFMSNPDEERLLASPAYQSKLARGIRDGIVTYSNLIAK